MKRNTKRTLKDWITVARPWSFPASMVPVLATAAYTAYRCGGTGDAYDTANAALALVMLVAMHAAANLIGDYHDHVRKVDLPGSLNGVHAIYDGTFAPREVLRYGYLLLAAGCALGAMLLLRTGLQGIWIGVAGCVLVVCYPWLKYHRLGDLGVLLGFAVLPALGTAYVMTGHYMWQAPLTSLAYGTLTVAILHANNTRDILNDTRAGISTLCMSIGGAVSQRVYLAEIAAGYTAVALMAACGIIPALSLLTFLSLPLAVKNTRQMMQAEPLAEAPIADLDQKTAQLQLAFGILYMSSFVIAAFL